MPWQGHTHSLAPHLLCTARRSEKQLKVTSKTTSRAFKTGNMNAAMSEIPSFLRIEIQRSCERSLSLEIIVPRNKWILAYLKTFLGYGGKERTAKGSLLLLFLNEVSPVLCLVGRHSFIFQVCMELDSGRSP